MSLCLCCQAMGLMLPHPSKSDTEGTLGGRNPSLEGKMACMSVAGYAACAKSNVALDSVLDEIKVGMLSVVRVYHVRSGMQTDRWRHKLDLGRIQSRQVRSQCVQ